MLSKDLHLSLGKNRIKLPHNLVYIIEISTEYIGDSCQWSGLVLRDSLVRDSVLRFV